MPNLTGPKCSNPTNQEHPLSSPQLGPFGKWPQESSCCKTFPPPSSLLGAAWSVDEFFPSTWCLGYWVNSLVGGVKQITWLFHSLFIRLLSNLGCCRYGKIPSPLQLQDLKLLLLFKAHKVVIWSISSLIFIHVRLRKNKHNGDRGNRSAMCSQTHGTRVGREGPYALSPHLEAHGSFVLLAKKIEKFLFCSSHLYAHSFSA